MATHLTALPERIQRIIAQDPAYANLPDDKVLLTEKEAAQWLSLPPATLRTWRSRGAYDIRTVKLGASVRYPWAEVLRLAEGLESNS